MWRTAARRVRSSLLNRVGSKSRAAEGPAVRSYPQVRYLFWCSAAVDEVYIRSTALAAARAGHSVRVVIVGEVEGLLEVFDCYREIGIDIVLGAQFSDAAWMPAEVCVTASSGLDRTILPTAAEWLVHMPHSIASLHMIYPRDAFLGYDALFATGPHHEVEFNELLRRNQMQSRPSFPVGYGKLDVLSVQKAQLSSSAGEKDAPHVLVAPSWGPDNLIDSIGVQLVDALLERDWLVTVRPHPLIIGENGAALRQIKLRSETEPGLTVELGSNQNTAICVADILVGDYSGTSFEFAALNRKRVVSVNVGRKVTNPSYVDFDTEPVEVRMRADLGPVVDPDPTQIVQAVEMALIAPLLPSDCIEAFLYEAPGKCGGAALAALEELRNIEP